MSSRKGRDRWEWVWNKHDQETSPHEVGVYSRSGRKHDGVSLAGVPGWTMVVVVVECYFFLIIIIVGEGQARPVRLASAGCSFSMKIELPLRKKHQRPNSVVVVVPRLCVPGHTN